MPSKRLIECKEQVVKHPDFDESRSLRVKVGPFLPEMFCELFIYQLRVLAIGLVEAI